MSNPFFDHPILDSPYDDPGRHWDLDEQRQPTQHIVESRPLATRSATCARSWLHPADLATDLLGEDKGLFAEKR